MEKKGTAQQNKKPLEVSVGGPVNRQRSWRPRQLDAPALPSSTAAPEVRVSHDWLKRGAMYLFLGNGAKGTLRLGISLWKSDDILN